MPVQKLNVVMLGGQGVGKSSLMAVLYNSLKTELQTGPLILNALGGTADRLEVLFNQLMEFGYTGEPSRGIQKTPDPAYYDFELAWPSTTDLPGTPQDFSLHISFTDYPGEYIRENQVFVRDKINEASAVLIAIDTPALMEEPFLNERMNATNYFSSLLQSVFGASRTPRLVLLTPIKCERWVQSLDGTRDLTERIKSGPYKDLLDNLASMTTTAPEGLHTKPYVAVAITPIQTVGSVVFSHFDKDEFGRPMHVWKKSTPEAPFAPVDCDQPLRYLMGFLIEQHLEHRRSPEHHFEAVSTAFAGRNVPGVVQGVLRAGAAIVGQVADHAAHLLGTEGFWSSSLGQMVDFFSGNEGFRKAVAAFAVGAKRLPPFELMQGGYLIADHVEPPALAEALMRLFVRAAGWDRGYYWTKVTAAGTRDAGQVPVEHYFELLRNQDSLAPSLSLYHSAAGYQVLCLGLATRRNEPVRRVITNSLLIEWPQERPARLFAAAVLAGDERAAGGVATVFRTAFALDLDGCIDHDTTRDHYRVDATRLHGLVEQAITGVAGLDEPDAFPDDVFLERLFARNSPERRRELQAALCRYELPTLPPGPAPRLLLAVAGLEDAERLCDAGAWVALSDRCPVEAWTIFGMPHRPPLRDRC